MWSMVVGIEFCWCQTMEGGSLCLDFRESLFLFDVEFSFLRNSPTVCPFGTCVEPAA